jgi:hypothetical protein
MPAKRKTARKTPDHRFRARYDRDVAWDEDTANELLTLLKGLKVKIFAYDPVMNRVDFKLRFPRGYGEPRHRHKGGTAFS